jgi:hypothetical protein
MRRITITFILVLFLVVPEVFAQQQGATTGKLSHYSISAGTGWTHYIDNLEYGNKNLSQDFAGFNLRFYWEPEYRLSLGAETGYYNLFRAKAQPGSSINGDITRHVVPFFLLVRMRIIDRFYLGTGFGFAGLTNTASYNGQTIKTTATSLSNYQFSASYIYPLSHRWQLGGEAKVYSFGAYNDWMYSFQVFCAYRF